MPNTTQTHSADDMADTQTALDETFGTLPDLEIPDRDGWARLWPVTALPTHARR